jgi:hypothetical protein
MENELSFEIITCPSALTGRPHYNIEDHSFNFSMSLGQEIRCGKMGTTSFAIDTLQLEVSIENLFCLYCSGYCPVESWKGASLSPPTTKSGSLRANYKNQLHPAISVCIDDMVPPDAWFDTNSGWFCMGRKEPQGGAAAVEFATGCLAIVIDKKLSSLWIQPENWRKVAELIHGKSLAQ